MINIIICTCKKYEEVAQLMERNLLQLNLNGVFITDYELNIQSKQIIEENKIWSLRLKRSLEAMDEDYILMMLEDYFILDESSKINLKYLKEVVEENNLNYLRIVNIPKIKLKEKINKIGKNMPYGINLQLSVWKRQYLIEILNNIHGNPWQTEIALKDNIKIDEFGYYSKAAVINTNIQIYNAIIKGKWRRNYQLKLKNLNIINTKQLPVMSKLEEIKYEFIALIGVCIGYGRTRIIVKKILRIFGIKFMME